MQVRLTTTVETIIDIDPDNNPSYEETKGEILGRLHECDIEDISEGVKGAHAEAVVFDNIRTQTVTHSFEEVK